MFKKHRIKNYTYFLGACLLRKIVRIDCSGPNTQFQDILLWVKDYHLLHSLCANILRVFNDMGPIRPIVTPRKATWVSVTED